MRKKKPTPLSDRLSDRLLELLDVAENLFYNYESPCKRLAFIFEIASGAGEVVCERARCTGQECL